MGRPVQDIRINALQHRAKERHRKRWIVRWSVDGRQRSKSFATQSEASRYRSLLIEAHRRGEVFDRGVCEPASWLPSAEGVQVHVWAQRWLAEQWPEWQPRTRDSAVEGAARFVPLMVGRNASAPPEGLRRYLKARLVPDVDVDEAHPCERWLARWSLQLHELDRATLADVDRQLAVGDAGQPLSPSSTARFRKLARACIRRAVELDILTVDPWPPAPRGRSRRKAMQLKKRVDVRSLPDPATMARVLDAVPTHQPATRMYRVLFATMYYAGLRPSEAVMLRPRALHLPAQGWGRIDVVEADISFDEPGAPKTGERTVPIPPVLVVMLTEWLASHRFKRDEQIFRSRTGRRPTASNMARSWQRALRAIGYPSLRVYDCRHAAATTWLAAGVPLGEVARRMGHSVETLVATYVGALTGDEQISNDRIDALLNRAVETNLRVVDDVVGL